MSERGFRFFGRRGKKSAEEQPPSTPEQQEAKKKNQLTRRDVLKGMGAAAAVAAVGIRESGSGGHHTSEGIHVEKPEVTEAEDNRFRLLDMTTATAVVAGFAEKVLWQGAFKEIVTGQGGESLGSTSATTMNALAAGRIAGLDVFGGEQGREVAAEEIHELWEGYKLVPLLVAMSDLTTTELKVDPDELLNKAAVERLDYTAIQRPELGAPREAWEAHLEKVNSDLVNTAAEISGITAALAPLGTTYASSALGNRLKQGMLRILYEQSYAKAVLAEKGPNGGDPAILNEEAIHQTAAQRTDTEFNGYFGYSKLSLTLSSNVQGAWGAGDPPEMFFLKDHGTNGTRVAIAEAAGFANAQVSSLALNAGWLAKIGALNGNASAGFVRFFEAQGKAFAGVAEALVSEEQRSVSFNRGRVFADRLIAAAAGAPDEQTRQQIQTVLEQIPQAALQLDMQTYASKWIEASKQVLGKVRGMFGAATVEDAAPHFSEADTQSAEAYGDSNAFTELTKAAQRGDIAGMTKILEATDDIGRNVKVDQLTELFQVVVDAHAAESANFTPDAVLKASPESLRPTAEDVQRTKDVISTTQRVMEEFQSLSTETREQRVEKALQSIGAQPGQSSQEVYDALSAANQGDVYKAMKQLVEIPDATKDQAQPEAHAAHPEKSLLSHSAKEVLWALLTQVPVVASAARLANYTIPWMMGMEKGKRPTASQAERVVTMNLATVAGMSAFADNVAAYMFGEKGLTMFFKETYGEDILDRYPTLAHLVTIMPLKIAEQAGSLTKVGNGPNFAQKKYRVERSQQNAQGIDIVEEELSMVDTFKNGHSQIANAMLIGIAAKLFSQEIRQIEADFQAVAAKAA